MMPRVIRSINPRATGLQPSEKVLALRKMVVEFLADYPGAQTWEMQLEAKARGLNVKTISNTLYYLRDTDQIYHITEHNKRYCYYLTEQKPRKVAEVEKDNPIVKRRPKSQWKKWPGPVRSPMGWTAHELGSV